MVWVMGTKCREDACASLCFVPTHPIPRVAWAVTQQALGFFCNSLLGRSWSVQEPQWPLKRRMCWDVPWPLKHQQQNTHSGPPTGADHVVPGSHGATSAHTPHLADHAIFSVGMGQCICALESTSAVKSWHYMESNIMCADKHSPCMRNEALKVHFFV